MKILVNMNTISQYTQIQAGKFETQF